LHFIVNVVINVACQKCYYIWRQARTGFIKYNRLGAVRKNNVRHGRRREARCIMSLEKEKQFLHSIEKEALPEK
jgi:hypothetical protein